MTLLTRRGFVGGALALASSLPAYAALMTPATATVHFQHEGDDTVLRFSFVELLWREQNGEVDCHLEIDTQQFVSGGVTNGRPGRFRKGDAQGAFYISFGPQHQPTNRQFWWPPGSVSAQPPIKGGQNRSGRIARLQGLARNSFTTGYELPAPSPQLVNGDMRLYFEMSGFGKPLVRLSAEHFIDQGDVRIYCDFAYMTGQ